jgi:Ribosomal protein L7/L12 C-terminal domain
MRVMEGSGATVGGGFQVVLTSAGEKKVKVTKVVRRATRLRLTETLELVNNPPTVIADELDHEAARRLAADLIRAGASAEVEPMKSEVPSLAAQKKKKEEESRTAWLETWLQPNETVEATIRTSELVMKNDVVFTSSKVLIAGVHDDPAVESVPYDSIASFRATWNWLSQEVSLDISGTRREITLRFATRQDYDRAREILNRHVV